MVITIDSTNVGGGGGVTHLQELLYCLAETFEGLEIEKVQIIASTHVLKVVPTHDGFQKVNHDFLNKGIVHRLIYQLFLMKRELKETSVLLSITGDYFGSFRPLVGMSRNMLPYRKDIWFDPMLTFSERMKFWLSRQRQKVSFKKSDGIIFISNNAKEEILSQLKLKSKRTTVIHHGVSSRFSHDLKPQKEISSYTDSSPFKFIYVSSVHVYKYQWNVIEAIKLLRNKGYPVSLDLIGPIIFKNAGDRMLACLEQSGNHSPFLNYLGEVPYNNLTSYFQETDGIIFASSCENMPNILIESMNSGRPIACSNFDPMPEFIGENTFYFNPTTVDSICTSLEEMLLSRKIREEHILKNKELAKKFTWKKTTKETIEFISTFNKKINV